MLVLSRKKQEEIIVLTPQGEQILLKVIKINESSIRIGLEAKPDYQIIRGELMETRSCRRHELVPVGNEPARREVG